LAATATLWILSAPARAVDLVLDSANLAEAMAMAKSMGEQLSALQSQLDTLKSQYATITNLYNEARGVTQHATMLANSAEDLHSMFPTVEYDLSEVLSGPLNAVATGLRKAKELVSFDVLKENEGAHLPSLELYKERGEVVYAYMSAAKQSYDEFAKRRAMLDTFRQAASTANTQKAVLDLNTRISAETVFMLNDIAMLQSLTLMAQMEQANLDYNETGLALYRPSSDGRAGTDSPEDWSYKYKGAKPTDTGGEEWTIKKTGDTKEY
jgi:type IV secretion system protein VirB5